LIILLIGVLFFLFFGLYIADWTLVFVSIGGLLMLLIVYHLVFNTILKIEFEENKISYSFSPFTFSKKSILISDILSIDIQVIDAVREFGGYGFRIKGNTLAYIVNNQVVRIICKNGKTIFLSISNIHQIKEYINFINLG
jgi:hypothetical protein